MVASQRDRQAWIACYPGLTHLTDVCIAFIEVDCVTGQTLEVAETVARSPHVATVAHTSGRRDLYLVVLVPDLGTLSHYLLTGLGSLPGIQATRTHIATRVFTEGSQWRLGALDSKQRDRMAPPPPRRGHVAAPSISAVRRVPALLGQDGRASYTELARRLEVSTNTARRRLNTLMASGQLIIRCDMSRLLSGWSVSAFIWANAAPDDLPETARLIRGLPETRLCTALTGGPANLLVSLLLRSEGDIQRVESQLAERIPSFTVVDRAISLRHIKRMGHLLDASDRSTHVVPIDIWATIEAQPK